MPLEGELEHHLGLSVFFFIRERNANGGAERQCRWRFGLQTTPQLLPKKLDPAGRRGITGQCACLVNGDPGFESQRCLWKVCSSITLGLVVFLSENGMQTGVQSSASAAGDLVCKPPLSLQAGAVA